MISNNGPGRPLGELPLDALRLTAKTGFICRETWNLFFSRGNPRWMRRQLFSLLKHDLLKPHTNPVAKNIFVLGYRGRELLEKEQIIAVTPPMINTVAHDRVIMQTLYRLNQQKIITNWNSEAEIKRENLVDSQVRIKNGQIKYSDATGTFFISGKPRMVAIEYERERKSFSRYREILFAYAGLNKFSLILYICETEAIRKAIQSTADELGNPNLLSRLGFVDAVGWKSEPESAIINIRGGTIKLKDVCNKNDIKLAA